jgi:hypothetical protein
MKEFILVLLVILALFIMTGKKQNGITGYEIVQDIRSLDSKVIDYIQVFCREGKSVLVGGVNGYTESTSLEILATHPATFSIKSSILFSRA